MRAEYKTLNCPSGKLKNPTSENCRSRMSSLDRILKRFHSPNLKPLVERICLAKTNQNPHLEPIDIQITLEEMPILKNYLKILPSRRVQNPEKVKHPSGNSI